MLLFRCVSGWVSLHSGPSPLSRAIPGCHDRVGHPRLPCLLLSYQFLRGPSRYSSWPISPQIFFRKNHFTGRCRFSYTREEISSGSSYTVILSNPHQHGWTLKTLSERNKFKKARYGLFHLYDVSRICKSIETEIDE